MHGMESAHLISSWLQRLNAFQLKGLRQILKIDTTFVDRANTSQIVLSRTSHAMGTNRVLTLSEGYAKQKIKFAKKIIKQPDCEPTRACTYVAGTARPRHNVVNRVGRPRQKWADGVHAAIWQDIKQSTDTPAQEANPKNMAQQDLIHLAVLAEDTDR